MLNRTVHQASSSVLVPVPYKLAKAFKAQGYDINVLVRDLLENLAASSSKPESALKEDGGCR